MFERDVVITNCFEHSLVLLRNQFSSARKFHHSWNTKWFMHDPYSKHDFADLLPHWPHFSIVCNQGQHTQMISNINFAAKEFYLILKLTRSSLSFFFPNLTSLLYCHNSWANFSLRARRIRKSLLWEVSTSELNMDSAAGCCQIWVYQMNV